MDNFNGDIHTNDANFSLKLLAYTDFLQIVNNILYLSRMQFNAFVENCKNQYLF